MVLGVKQRRFPMVELRFLRLSDWFATSLTNNAITIDTNPENFTMTNNGNAPQNFMVFRFRSNAASGFVNPSLTNTTNGYTFATTRDAVNSSSELKVDTELLTVGWSTNDGSSYANDYALFTPGANQVGFMRLEPGGNSISIGNTGTPNYSLEYAFYAAYH